MRATVDRIATVGDRRRVPAPIPDDYPRDVWSPRLGRITRPRAEIEELTRDVERIAEPIAAYLLVWLWANRR